MRPYARLSACCIAFGLLLGCRQNVPPPATAPHPPTDVQREMATLAFISYLGDALTGPDVEAQLEKCLSTAFEKQADIRRWKLAWGPAVYRFPIGKYDDNMMFVARNTQNPAHLVVVVRGTNFSALLNWLVEDFDVDDQVAWILPEGKSVPGQPKISKGTSEGLHILQSKLTATSDTSTQPQTLLQFLQAQAQSHPSGLQIDVTGHSLGGALSPTLALWLSENLGNSAKISVYPLAGPTPGNSDFATYYDSVLGSSTHRLWNPFDVVPQAWNYESMGKMADLYEPLIRANPAERGLIDGLRSLVQDKDYAQIDPTHPPLSGAVSTDPFGKKADWLGEAGWQHHCGYQCALGISVMTDAPGCPSSTAKYICPQRECPDPFEKKSK
jgi:hypothetical protein